MLKIQIFVSTEIFNDYILTFTFYNDWWLKIFKLFCIFYEHKVWLLFYNKMARTIRILNQIVTLFNYKILIQGKIQIFLKFKGILIVEDITWGKKKNWEGIIYCFKVSTYRAFYHHLEVGTRIWIFQFQLVWALKKIKLKVRNWSGTVTRKQIWYILEKIYFY